MNVKGAAIVRAMAKGNSLHATARFTETAKVTVLKLLVELGELCFSIQDHDCWNVPTRRVAVDEIWALVVGAKQKNTTKDGQGALWRYTAIDAELS